ncbi:MAG: endonuclease III domain-containing protein, partial [Mesorhizobium sp.]
MSTPKPKDRRTPKTAPKGGRRDGSNAVVRPRPARPFCLYSQAEVHEIFRRFSVQRPEPEGELEYVNAFTLLVAVVLSAQATDAGVNKATRGLFKAADTPEKMAALGEEKIGA